MLFLNEEILKDKNQFNELVCIEKEYINAIIKSQTKQKETILDYMQKFAYSTENIDFMYVENIKDFLDKLKKFLNFANSNLDSLNNLLANLDVLEENVLSTNLNEYNKKNAATFKVVFQNMFEIEDFLKNAFSEYFDFKFAIPNAPNSFSENDEISSDLNSFDLKDGEKESLESYPSQEASNEESMQVPVSANNTIEDNFSNEIPDYASAQAPVSANNTIENNFSNEIPDYTSVQTPASANNIIEDNSPNEIPDDTSVQAPASANNIIEDNSPNEIPDDTSVQVPASANNTIEDSVHDEIVNNYRVEQFKPISSFANENLPSENTLIISESKGIVYLPYTDRSLEKKQNKEPNLSKEEVVKKYFSKPYKFYKNPSISRFREAFSLMRTKEHASVIEAFDLGMELFFNYNLHPAIITACNNLDELDVYLDYLENGETNKFNCFKIKFDVAPTVVKNKKLS